MTVRLVPFAIAAALLAVLVGCDRQDSSQPVQGSESTPPSTGQTGDHPQVSVSTASGGAAATSAAPDYAALEQVRDPARILRFLGDALADRRWNDAARAWGEAGSASAATLQERFAAGAPITLTFGQGETEGAAGSLYYSVPYTLRRSDGSAETGTITLRRVNNVPGATPASLRWHVASMEPGSAQ
ncbi:hypothetical protein NT2_04_00590 [Caenibius tardaugens NBRC 16725]|uniref:Lipoprotein n=1 Tax=Caenibius tardaugens NBRC 16725 TaxID=1219035 RepID=U3A1L0_9SPHN|nr:hypothetical protein [Caenibius tardaugens]AZI36245.1 hypothetical protein EGO55_09985 [Caenibius tardaugens NBRC 16725]GAD48648.1 hypothetical protein NT2_04_00590 [Caenibius tardaugens NBRC 16725]